MLKCTSSINRWLRGQKYIYIHLTKLYFNLISSLKIILKDVSEMESELLSIEAELQQEASTRKETTQFWETCSGHHCDTEELKEELKKDNERLLQVIKFWTPKGKVNKNLIHKECI